MMGNWESTRGVLYIVKTISVGIALGKIVMEIDNALLNGCNRLSYSNKLVQLCNIK